MYLKRLDILGFKTFAEKTELLFTPGITAVVGPNGSGKSNIVDAVRWILGEQSAKSLRGGEMADVIFNGSTTRRSLGLAEVTMTFDNNKQHLAVQTEEVQITRRVYRSGEGEYLINQQICRLKDIKDLFLGSGAGADAYCIIEQGKVDVLLQATTKDRREIFEEAAGISRFKAKKIETQRRLERAQQNLERLKDIIDEVDKQLRSIKLQASKAQRYQEYSDRLKELRISLGLAEYHQFVQKLESEAGILENLRNNLAQRASRAESHEAETTQLETVLADLEDRLRHEEGILANVRQRIQTEESTLQHEGTFSADMEAELGKTRGRLAELTGRVAALAAAAAQAEEELAGADALAEEQRRIVADLADKLQLTVIRLGQLHEQVEADKGNHLEQMRRAAHVQNEVIACKAQRDNLARERDRLRQKNDHASESLASVDFELQGLTQGEAELLDRVAAARQRLADERNERGELAQQQEKTRELLSELRQKHSGLCSRAEILEGLLRTHEGLGAGVREVFALLDRSGHSNGGQSGSGWGSVLGMIADFLTVRREYAALIDLALGDWAQRFIVRDVDQLVQALGERSEPFAGRVSFVPLERRLPDNDESPANGDSGNGDSHSDRKSHQPPHSGTILRLGSSDQPVEVAVLQRISPPVSDVFTHPGIVARAEQLVACDHPLLADLPGQLLGGTLIVRDLAAAREISAHGFRIITLQGELLEADGTLTVGRAQEQSGILTRKSELQDLRHEVVELESRIADTDRQLAMCRERIQALDSGAGTKQEEMDVLLEQAAELRGRLQRHQDRRQGLHEEVTLGRDELGRVCAEIATLETALDQAHHQAAQAETLVAAIQERLQQADVEIRQGEQDRQERQEACTVAQVALAKMEERFRALEARHQKLIADLSQLEDEMRQSQDGLTHCQTRLADSQQNMLAASAALAQAYLDKEASQRTVEELVAQRDHARQERARLAALAQTVRNEWRVLQEHLYSRELEVNDLRHHQSALADRIRDDYQVELSELYQKQFTTENTENTEKKEEGELKDSVPSAQEQSSSSVGSVFSVVKSFDPDEANLEIEELRKKLSRLGSVNLDALTELNDLENRAKTLQTQYDDLVSAKKSLEDIIAKINNDSRRLFVDCFNAVRTHFQELFRKLFGGGMADVMFEDDSDVLESGIEIIARPPGKELRSISLMSGGEKTLTAVALLLAIFRSKPSPFCILDEVDAALDEANIDRFTSVLREFLDRSQFILVTHSKKTMAAADVLYGITMQESGISKQVSVRFEDWPEDEAAPQGEKP